MCYRQHVVRCNPSAHYQKIRVVGVTDNTWLTYYGVATVSRIDEIIGLFGRILSLL